MSQRAAAFFHSPKLCLHFFYSQHEGFHSSVNVHMYRSSDDSAIVIILSVKDTSLYTTTGQTTELEPSYRTLIGTASKASPEILSHTQ